MPIFRGIMTAVSFLEKVYLALAAVGMLGALVFDHLAMAQATKVSLLVFLLAAVAFGLDMIVTRKAEISTRYFDRNNPSFHVFRGASAVAWGIVFIVFTAFVIGFTVIEMTGWTGAQDFFRERPGILIALLGVLVTAWGFANAGKATYRQKEDERPARRLGDRIVGVLVIPIGLCIFGLGVLESLAPAAAAALQDAAGAWILSLILR